MRAARRGLLSAVLALTVVSPSPSPVTTDSATLGQQQLEYFQQLGTSFTLAVQRAVAFELLDQDL